MRLLSSPSLAVAALVAALAVVGCSAKPLTARKVDQSVLPANAKALLVNNAQIDHVVEETYAKGTKIYNIFYTVDGGRMQSVRYNSRMVTTPTGVFEEPIR